MKNAPTLALLSLAALSATVAAADAEDGVCKTYKVVANDNCAGIADKYKITVDDLVKFNENHTYGWKGCEKLQIGQTVCVSEGDAPRPDPDPNAECGILAPGDKFNSTCPLNACCSEFGHCGTGEAHCGTGCYSQCGFGSLTDDPVAPCFMTTAYWMDKPKTDTMYQNIKDVDGKYDILFYSFATIGKDMSIQVDDGFKDFLEVCDSQKIVSFGGWDFSTSPDTYDRFREAINSTVFLDNLVDFITKNNLDGVNFDWEYPGQPDIAGIPAGTPYEGTSYTTMMSKLRDRLTETSISVAVPASYWYLKAYPLEEMNKVVDFFVFMTYDFHGQWDYSAGTGVMCHTNKTDIEAALKVMDKAQIPFSSIYGGVANYGKSFELSSMDCTAVGCPFTGPESGAAPGPITNSSSVLTENEILAIPVEDRITYDDKESWCQVVVQKSNHNWVAWTNEAKRHELSQWYQSIGLGGDALWAANYLIPVTKSQSSVKNHMHRRAQGS